MLDCIMQGFPFEPEGRAHAAQKLRHCCCNGWNVVRICKLAEAPIVQGVDRAICVACNDWRSASQRLQENNSESFPSARHREDIRKTIVVRKLILGNEARKCHPLCNTQLASNALQSRPIRTFTNDDVSNRACVGRNCW